MVAADWLTTTSATTAAIGATLPSVDHERPVSPKWGAPWATVPTTLTPWAASPSAPTSSVEPIRPTNAPGSFRSIRSAASTTARTTRPIPTVHPLEFPKWLSTVATRWMVVPLTEGCPMKSGSWWTTMITATPPMKPVMIGVERNSAIQPRRKSPISATMAPTVTARIPDQCDVIGRPGRRQVGHPDREERCDRGVRPDRHPRV